MPNKLCCPVCKLSDLSYQPNYDQYLFSYTRFFNFLSFGERERERGRERRCTEQRIRDSSYAGQCQVGRSVQEIKSLARLKKKHLLQNRTVKVMQKPKRLIDDLIVDPIPENSGLSVIGVSNKNLLNQNVITHIHPPALRVEETPPTRAGDLILREIISRPVHQSL